MENTDLKYIKKHYGEKFSHLCRDLFPTFLEIEGLLPKVISEHFLPSRELYDDLVNNNLTNMFKNYIYGLVDIDPATPIEVKLSPEELMDKAGYILYPECQTEEDIQKFRHYYKRGEATPIYRGGQPKHWEGEELCTFNGGRLKSCRVWFAVKKNVDEIRREDYKNPRREDDYGVSVLSIQFTKTHPATLSIKNRYNHTVSNPDATFSNDLDNIIVGLTQSFIKNYNIDLIESSNTKLSIPGYVQASDGIYYKYNLELDNVYCCPNNVIIYNGEAKHFDKEKFLVFDNFILDIKNKEILKYNHKFNKNSDSFIESIGKIEEIKRVPTKEGLTLQITPAVGETVEIKLNKHNEIIEYTNPNVTEIGNGFLRLSEKIEKINLPNVTKIGHNFLHFNNSLTQINLPNVQQIGSNFLNNNNVITEINLPNVQQISDSFLSNNNSLKKLNLPKVKNIGNFFISNNNVLTEINLPVIQNIGDYFLRNNQSLKTIILPMIEKIGNSFLESNYGLVEIKLPMIQKIGDDFLANNTELNEINMPYLLQVGDNFLSNCFNLKQIDLPNILQIGNNFLQNNLTLEQINLPYVLEIGNNFLLKNQILRQINLPNVEKIGNACLFENLSLTYINFPEVQQIGDNFISNNSSISQINLPKVKNIGNYFLYVNESLKSLDLPEIEKIGDYFLYVNESLKILNLPKIQKVGQEFLGSNFSLIEVNLSQKLKTLEQKLLADSTANQQNSSNKEK